MKVTLKDFLVEQQKLGVKVPQIFEELNSITESNTTAELVDEISNVQEELKNCAQYLRQIYQKIRKTGNSRLAEQMKSYIISHLEILIDSEHEWMDRSTNLEDIKNQLDDMIGDENEESEENFETDPRRRPRRRPRNFKNENKEFNLTENQALTEGFFDKIKNAFSGTVEYNTANNYAGSPEAQKFIATDKRSKIQIDTLIKKGMTPEQAKSAVMYVFDKSDKNPLGFVGKSVVFDTQTSTLKVSNSGNLGGGLGQ